MSPDERDIAPLLAGFVRRHPKKVGLNALELLQIVTREDFKCRICRKEVEVQPRSVLGLDNPGDESLDRYITVCNSCRLRLLKAPP